MKKQIISWLIVIAFIALSVFIYFYGSKPVIPAVGEGNKINGNYTIEGIMKLGKPYVCTFEKTDGGSKVVGTIHTDGQNIYGEFRIRTDLVKNEFNSFLLVKDDVAYNWTSLGPLGYKSAVADSASKNASPKEQAQIVGTKDKIEYKCESWLEVDKSTFEPPSWITFTELKN